MKLLKLTLAAAVSLFSVGALHAQDTAFTYTFKANADSGDTGFDGSSITILDNNIIAWNLEDNDRAIYFVSGSGDGSQVLPTLTDITYSDPNVWSGNFIIANAATLEASTICFIGDDNGTTASNGGDLYDNGLDPTGCWTGVTDPAVPDTLNCLQLLALALAGLGVSHLILSNQRAVLVRK